MSQVSPATPPPLPAVVQAKWHAVGVWLAIASCVLPVLPFGIAMFSLIVFRWDPLPKSWLVVFWISQALGGLCGVTALLGMWKWGHQTVWMLACVGLALGGFWVGMTFTGDAH